MNTRNHLQSHSSHSLKKFVYVMTISVFVWACNGNNEKTSEVEKEVQKPDTSPAVTGIGGIFFESENPEKTLGWYEQNLGMKTDLFGAVFETRNALNPDQENYLRWSPMHQKDTFFQPSKQPYMINYRVRNLEAMVRQMRSNGVVIVDSVMTFDYGKFVHIMDPDGRKIELWEPIDSVLKKMGGSTNK